MNAGDRRFKSLGTTPLSDHPCIVCARRAALLQHGFLCVIHDREAFSNRGAERQKEGNQI